MHPAILPVIAFLVSAAAIPAVAQSDRREIMEAAFQMGRVLLGIGELPLDGTTVLPSPSPLPEGEGVVGGLAEGEGIVGGLAEGEGAVGAPAKLQPLNSKLALAVPLDGPEAKMRDALIEARLPLAPEDLVHGERLVLIGDKPYLPQGRAWLIQSATALAKRGITHIGFEILRADQQDALDDYRAGRLARSALLARLLGDNDVRFKESRRLAFEETVSAVDAVLLAGLRVVALGLPRADEDQAFRELTGRTKRELRAAGRARYAAALRDSRAPLDRLQSDDLARRTAEFLRAEPAAQMVLLASAGRLSRYSAAGRLAQEGFQARRCGFFFPESEKLNRSLEKASTSVRYSEYWAYVPLDRRDTGLDALLIAPASLPQPSLR